MFSLNALMSQAATTPVKPPPKPASDDSGLIDLKKLLSEPNEEAPKAELFSTHVDVFPLGRPPSPSTDAVEISLLTEAPKPARKSKAAKIAGASLLAAALAVAAWGMVKPVQPVMAAETGIMAAATSRVPVIEAEPPPAPEPPVVAAPEPPKTPVIRQPVIRHNPIVKPLPVVKQPPPPPVDTTPCDLRCQMERAVKKQTATPKR